MESPIESRQRDRTCAVEGCNRKHYGHGVCKSHYNRMARRIRWAALIKEKGGCCSVCKGVFPIEAYDLHHRDPSQKESSVSLMMGRNSWESIQAEAEKCDLCAPTATDQSTLTMKYRGHSPFSTPTNRTMNLATETFDKALQQVLKVEGGYSNDRLDSGGATNYGITEAVARASGYTGPMNRISLDLAKQIYRAGYWNTMQLDAIVRAGCPDLAVELFCSGVNVGTGRAGRWLQRSLNVLNDRERHYRDLIEDGAIGIRTLRAQQPHQAQRPRRPNRPRPRRRRPPDRLLHLPRRTPPKDERFVFGWLNHRTH